jgi:hypothetical protein
MTIKRHVLTRREFLKSSSAAVAGTMLLGSPESVFAKPETKTRVVLVRNEDVLDDKGRLNADVLAEMLDEAVTTLLGEPDPGKVWGQLFDADDVVGVKSNEWSYLRTPYELEAAIRERILATGVNEKNLAIEDRHVRGNSIFREATALVNVRPLRSHHWSGVGSLLKNYIMFVRRPDFYHDDACADLGMIWHREEIKDKTRLNILVVLTPLFHGVGPHHYSAKYTWAYKGLLVGTDPVAVDATGVRILLAKRKAYFGEDRPINPPPKHVFLADTRHGLGTADPAKIDLVKKGWMEGVLI